MSWGSYCVAFMSSFYIREDSSFVCPAGKINDPKWVTLGEALEEHGLSATMDSLLPQRKDQLSRADYILLALFLGGLGVHNYYAGYRGKAEIQAVGTMLGLLVVFFIFRAIAFSIVVAVWVVLDIFCVKEDARGIPFK